MRGQTRKQDVYAASFLLKFRHINAEPMKFQVKPFARDAKFFADGGAVTVVAAHGIENELGFDFIHNIV